MGGRTPITGGAGFIGGRRARVSEMGRAGRRLDGSPTPGVDGELKRLVGWLTRAGLHTSPPLPRRPLSRRISGSRVAATG